MKSITTGAGLTSGSRFSVLTLILFCGAGCTLTATRPVQQYSDTTAALKAAREAIASRGENNADTTAVDLLREATETFNKAKRAYRQKNFDEAQRHLSKARRLAEQAELDAEMARAGVKNSLSTPPTAPDATVPDATIDDEPVAEPTP